MDGGRVAGVRASKLPPLVLAILTLKLSPSALGIIPLCRLRIGAASQGAHRKVDHHTVVSVTLNGVCGRYRHWRCRSGWYFRQHWRRSGSPWWCQGVGNMDGGRVAGVRASGLPPLVLAMLTLEICHRPREDHPLVPVADRSCRSGRPPQSGSPHRCPASR
ncbi:MAG: hypothetical protein R3E73_15240 [Porticoccaceae bacterium]